MEKIFKVEGMSCEHCKMRIEKALRALDGVEKAEASLAAKSVFVFFDPERVTAENLAETIRETGYEVEE